MNTKLIFIGSSVQFDRSIQFQPFLLSITAPLNAYLDCFAHTHSLSQTLSVCTMEKKTLNNNMFSIQPPSNFLQDTIYE